MKGEDAKHETNVHSRDEETAETQVRFQNSDSGQSRILLGPDSSNTQVYNYLKKQAAEFYGAFPMSVKGCVMSVMF